MSVCTRCEICNRRTTAPTKQGHVICSERCFLELQHTLELEALEAKSYPQESKTTLNVHGKGQVKVTPDRVSITVVIIKEGETTAAVNEALLKNSDALLRLLESKVAKLRTLDLSLSPIREKTKDEKEADERGVYYNGPKGRIIGYEGKFPISFETSVDNAGKMIDLALKDNYADVLENVQYIVSDVNAKSAYDKALRIATEDAQDKADIILSTLKLKKKGIPQIKIEETQYSPRIQYETAPESFRTKTGMAMAKKSTKLIAGETDIEANVTLTLLYQ